eukprot:TRINITY_DN26258_c0_g1_i1.p1 TRINITY_DN26258_c0_g1~~TRINITY_DN26258_c0_g1_i1.p1  ORF type:complete len:575 (+),score=89.72 TRINITY_DN26258_c0_g1_i1:87-1811(+)
MIQYDFGRWGLGFMFRFEGSVFHKSGLLGAGCAGATVLFRYIFSLHPEALKELPSGLFSMWTGFTGTLAFLLVFRTQIAYSRFWEGGTLLQKVKGVWFNAASNLIAFSSASPEKRPAVECFHHFLIRLFSMLYCVALQEVAEMEDENFGIIGCQGFEETHLIFLSRSEHRCEVIMQWIQRLIIDMASDGVITVAPPILSRVFQELSNGIVHVHDARKITEFKFPFPYAQMISCLLLIHWIVSAVLASLLQTSIISSCIVAYVTTFALWTLNYIAAEMEDPFGDDANDLPIKIMQENFNRALASLTHSTMQSPPKFEFDRSKHLLGEDSDLMEFPETFNGRFSSMSSCKEDGEFRCSVKSTYSGAPSPPPEKCPTLNQLNGSAVSDRPPHNKDRAASGDAWIPTEASEHEARPITPSNRAKLKTLPTKSDVQNGSPRMAPSDTSRTFDECVETHESRIELSRNSDEEGPIGVTAIRPTMNFKRLVPLDDDQNPKGADMDMIGYGEVWTEVGLVNGDTIDIELGATSSTPTLSMAKSADGMPSEFFFNENADFARPCVFGQEKRQRLERPSLNGSI